MSSQPSTRCSHTMADKETLLHVITLSEFGGAQDHVLALVRNLDRERFDVAVACAPGGVLIERLQGLCPIYEVPSMKRSISPFNDLKTIMHLVGIMRAGRFTIVHTHSSKAGVLGRLAARCAGVARIIHSIHGFSWESTSSAPMRGFFRSIETFLDSITGMTIIGTHLLRREALEVGLSRPERITTVHYGIDTQEVPVVPPRAAGGPIIGVIARLAEQKGVSYFLEAIPSLLHEFPEARFEIVGDGPLAAQLLAQAEALGIAEQTTFHGYRDDWKNVLAGFDVFVLPSLWEGLPLVLLSAMALSKPIVATNVGGIAEAITADHNGLLVQAHSHRAISEAVTRLLRDPELSRRLGDQARRTAVENFDERAMSRKVQVVYQQLGARG